MQDRWQIEALYDWERYIELHAASAFSFLEGASLPEDLIQRAAELDMPAMALLDREWGLRCGKISHPCP